MLFVHAEWSFVIKTQTRVLTLFEEWKCSNDCLINQAHLKLEPLNLGKNNENL